MRMFIRLDGANTKSKYRMQLLIAVDMMLTIGHCPLLGH
jgi:hypothetical protein